MQETWSAGVARARIARRAAAALLIALAPIASATRAAAGSGPSFATDAAPILDRWCMPCHGAREAHGGLRLDGYLALMRGGDSGPPLVPGRASESSLIAKIERRERPAMPPRRRLPPTLVARLRAWIDAGAPP